MTEACDFLIVGGGIAGSSAGYALSEHGKTIVLEREDQPSYHSMGCSAAQFTELYGNSVNRSLARVSKPFLENPPEGFVNSNILSPRGALFIATEAQRPQMEEFAKFAASETVLVHMMSQTDVCDMIPVMRPDAFQCGLLEPDSTDMDVHALQGGFLGGFRSRRGTVATNAEVTVLTRDKNDWIAETRGGDTYSAPVVVNAAGAWADVVAELAGIWTVGLVPKRRNTMLP